MKTCPHCQTGKLYRHSQAQGEQQGQRYRCSNPDCRKTITVRDGQIVDSHARPSRIVKDWRHAV